MLKTSAATLLSEVRKGRSYSPQTPIKTGFKKALFNFWIDQSNAQQRWMFRSWSDYDLGPVNTNSIHSVAAKISLSRRLEHSLVVPNER